jgi:uncharacterized protein (TIGR02996 family)
MIDEAFLCAISEAPEDEVLRLVYADWLDEKGKPERAELIRVQCELTHFTEDHPRRAVLEDREADLLIAHEADWRAELPTLPEYCSWGPFVRGFVEEVRFDEAQDLLARAEEILTVTPLIRLWLDGCDATELLSLGRAGVLARLRWFQISGAGAAEACQLAELPDFTNLRELQFIFSKVGDEGARALASSPHLSRLERIAFNSNGLQAEGVEALLTSPTLTSLVTLDLGYNWRDASRWMPILAASPRLARFKELCLDGVALEAQNLDLWRPLFASPYAANLQALNLHANHIGDEGVQELVSSPFLRGLTDLTLSANRISGAGVAVLASAPAFAGLQRLCLNYNNLSDDAAVALAEASQMRGLSTLEANQNAIGDAGVAALAASPNARHLRKLDLWGNRVSAAAARAIAESPLLARLSTLRLSGEITSEGAAAFVRPNQLTSLVSLDLPWNGIDDVGARALAEAVLPRLRELDLGHNAITGTGALAFLTSPLAQRLRKLELSRNPVGEMAGQLLRQRFGDRVALSEPEPSQNEE